MRTLRVALASRELVGVRVLAALDFVAPVCVGVFFRAVFFILLSSTGVLCTMVFFAFVSSDGVFFSTVFFVFASSTGVSLSKVVRGDFRVGIAAKLKFTFDVERTDGTNGCVGAAAAVAFVTGFGDWRVGRVVLLEVAFAVGFVSFDLLCFHK